MFRFLQRLLHKQPASLEEALWQYVEAGLTSDTKLLEGLLQLSGLHEQGAWSSMKLEADLACFRMVIGSCTAAANNLDRAKRLLSYGHEKMRARLVTKRAGQLDIFAAFSQLNTTAALDRLLSRCTYYAMIGEVLDSPSLPEAELLRITTESLWVGMLISYTGKETDHHLAFAGDTVREFMPRYVASQIREAVNIRSKVRLAENPSQVTSSPAPPGSPSS